jgi:hypothetical protein
LEGSLIEMILDNTQLMDLSDNISTILPIIIGGILGLLGLFLFLIITGGSGLIIRFGFVALRQVFDKAVRKNFGSGVKAFFIILGALLSVTLWAALYVELYFTLSLKDFLGSLTILLLPILGFFGIIAVPVPHIGDFDLDID